MDKHIEMLKSLGNLTSLQYKTQIPFIKENITLFTNDKFLIYWRSLIFELPTRIKTILYLFKEEVINKDFLIKILDIQEPNITIMNLMEKGEFSKVLTILRYLIYDEYLGFNIFKEKSINIFETLKKINLSINFFGFNLKQNNENNENSIQLDTFINYNSLLKYISNFSSDYDIILTEISKILYLRIDELYLEIDNFFEFKETLIKNILISKMDILIKIRILYFLIIEDINNLKLILENNKDILFLSLLFENLLSIKEPNEEIINLIESYLKDNPLKENICNEMMSFSEIKQEIFYKLFNVSRIYYKINNNINNKLKENIINLQFQDINKMNDNEFLNQFFEIVEPSITHFLVYTVKLKDILINRLRNNEFKKEFISRISLVSKDRITYFNIVIDKLKKSGILF